MRVSAGAGQEGGADSPASGGGGEDDPGGVRTLPHEDNQLGGESQSRLRLHQLLAPCLPLDLTPLWGCVGGGGERHRDNLRRLRPAGRRQQKAERPGLKVESLPRSNKHGTDVWDKRTELVASEGPSEAEGPAHPLESPPPPTQSPGCDGQEGASESLHFLTGLFQICLSSSILFYFLLAPPPSHTHV